MAEMGTGRVTLAFVVVARILTAEEGRAAETGSSDALPSRRIVVSLPDRALAVVENQAAVHIFPIAVGAASSPSPIGTFVVTNRVPRPTYYGHGKVVPPGPSNPIGTRWIGLNVKGYGIHGTDQPGSIGYARSHGCIRLRNRDVEALFELVQAGDVVEIVAERTPETEALFGAHADRANAAQVAASPAMPVTAAASPEPRLSRTPAAGSR